MAELVTPEITKVVNRALTGRRGAKPGERRGGRAKGQPNNASKTLKELAREYTPQALETLAQIMTAGDSESARVSAANAILDRGYGKPSQVLAGDEDGGAIKTITEVRRVVIDGNP